MEGIVWNFLQGRMGPMFFWGQNFALWQQKVKSSAQVYKGLLAGGGPPKKKKAQKLPYSEPKKIKNYHIFTMSSWRSPEQSRIL